ncbi:Hypothetical predicted protein, partial [Paramuricea clavata]
PQETTSKPGGFAGIPSFNDGLEGDASTEPKVTTPNQPSTQTVSTLNTQPQETTSKPGGFAGIPSFNDGLEGDASTEPKVTTPNQPSTQTVSTLNTQNTKGKAKIPKTVVRTNVGTTAGTATTMTPAQAEWNGSFLITMAISGTFVGLVLVAIGCGCCLRCGRTRRSFEEGRSNSSTIVTVVNHQEIYLEPVQSNSTRSLTADTICHESNAHSNHSNTAVVKT